MPIPVQTQDIANLLNFDRLRHPAIYETFSQPVTYNAALKRIQQTQERSMYWENETGFAAAAAELKKLAGFANGWDSYGAPAPSAAALALAKNILILLRRFNVAPTRVVASAEGGVGICFIEGEKYADLEIFNDEEVLATMYSGQSQPRIWELQNQEVDFSNAVEEIRAHLAA